MNNFVRFLIRCLLASFPFFFVYGFPIVYLNMNGMGGVLPTLVLLGISFWLSRLLLNKYNDKCDERDSKKIKNFTENNSSSVDYDGDRGCATYLFYDKEK